MLNYFTLASDVVGLFNVQMLEYAVAVVQSSFPIETSSLDHVAAV
jgi:hypothetical protein